MVHLFVNRRAQDGGSGAQRDTPRRTRLIFISQIKMMECLARLGRNVQIVIGPARRAAGAGSVRVLTG